MKKTRSLNLLAITILASLFGVATTLAAPTGQWDFDSGNLNATVGSPLTYADANTTTSTSFGSTTSFGISDIAGSPAQIMKFPAATNGGGH